MKLELKDADGDTLTLELDRDGLWIQVEVENGVSQDRAEVLLDIAEMEQLRNWLDEVLLKAGR